MDNLQFGNVIVGGGSAGRVLLIEARQLGLLLPPPGRPQNHPER
jgi:hypothetical protein